MIPKIAFLVLAVLNGGWMLFDGLHVMLKGKYFGPPEPGPWSRIFTSIGIDPFSLGPVFILLGVIWMISAIGILTGTEWAWPVAIIVAVCTLWYLPIGTVLAILLLWFYKFSFVR